jgi:hypothetical protein
VFTKSHQNREVVHNVFLYDPNRRLCPTYLEQAGECGQLETGYVGKPSSGWTKEGGIPRATLAGGARETDELILEFLLVRPLSFYSNWQIL